MKRFLFERTLRMPMRGILSVFPKSGFNHHDQLGSGVRGVPRDSAGSAESAASLLSLPMPPLALGLPRAENQRYGDHVVLPRLDSR